MIIDFKLWGHQQEALYRAKSMDHFALFFDCGTGKTLTTIQILRNIFESKKKMLRTFIACPSIVVENWKDEFLKFSKVPENKIVALKGPTKKRIADLQAAILEHEDFIAITNYQGLVANKSLINTIAFWKPQVLVCDESQMLKGHNTIRTRLMTALADEAEKRYILSGTPVLNGPMDLFSQFKILDKGKSLGRNFYSFRSKYFYDKNAGMPRDKYFPKWVPHPSAKKELNEIINRNGMIVKKDECLDLPPMVRTCVNVEMSPEQKRVYKQMRDEFVAEIEDKVVYADLALTRALRLMQITTGFYKDIDGEVHKFKNNPRKGALGETLAGINGKTIIWACFKQNYRDIRIVLENLGIPYVEATGEISENKKMEAVREFNEGEARVFIGHPGSLGVGINLTAASYSIYYSRNFSLEYDVQSEARNYRGGSERHKKITRIDLVTLGTIDEDILQALRNKKIVADEIVKKIVSTNKF